MYDPIKHWLIHFAMYVMDGGSVPAARHVADERASRKITKAEIIQQAKLADAVKDALYGSKTLSGVSTIRGTTIIDGGRGNS